MKLSSNNQKMCLKTPEREEKILLWTSAETVHTLWTNVSTSLSPPSQELQEEQAGLGPPSISCRCRNVLILIDPEKQ